MQTAQLQHQVLFPTTLSYVDFQDRLQALNAALVRDILAEKQKSAGQRSSNRGGWHSTPGLERTYASFAELCGVIQTCAREAARFQGYRDEGLCISNLWANVNGPGDYNMPHDHKSAVMAGVYYPCSEIVNGAVHYETHPAGEPVFVPGSGDGALVLYDQAYSFRKTNLQPQRDTLHTCKVYHVEPAASLLVLFLANLQHMVTPFSEDKQRLSISFSGYYE